MAPLRLGHVAQRGRRQPWIESHSVNERTSSQVPSVPASQRAQFDELELARVCTVLGIAKRRGVEAAAAECERELLLRERCYKGWVEAGKLSRIDATDRFNRLSDALRILKNLLASWPVEPDSTGGTDGLPF